MEKLNESYTIETVDEFESIDLSQINIDDNIDEMKSVRIWTSEEKFNTMCNLPGGDPALGRFSRETFEELAEIHQIITDHVDYTTPYVDHL